MIRIMKAEHAPILRTLHMRRDDSMQDKPWGQVVKYPPYMGDDSDALRKTIEAQEYPPYVEG